MQYNEIYNICQPVMDWLKEHYPHNHKIVIDTNGANLIEDGKLVVLDKNLKVPMLDEGSFAKDSSPKFRNEMLQKLFDYENQPEPEKS